MQAVVFQRPLFLAAQLESPHSGKGCAQQVSNVNGHIWGWGWGFFSVLLGTYQWPHALCRLSLIIGESSRCTCRISHFNKLYFLSTLPCSMNWSFLYLALNPEILLIHAHRPQHCILYWAWETKFTWLLETLSIVNSLHTTYIWYSK